MVMKEHAKILELKDNVTEVISKLEERNILYARKIEISEQRIRFSNANRKYELQRGGVIEILRKRQVKIQILRL